MENEPKKTEPIIKLTQFTFAYGTRSIFEHVDLNIKAGQVYGIVGDNGAGKTTLFNIISGNIDIKIEGQLLPPPRDIAVLQATPYFYPYMTGLEYLKIVGQYSKEKVDIWNSIFDLPLNEYVHNYSTGMQKKLSIMGVMLLEKKIIIMDEPFNGLDLKSSETVNIIIERLKETGNTILLSSHILETILHHADHVILVKDKQLSQSFDRTQFSELARIIKGEFLGDIREKVDKLIL